MSASMTQLEQTIIAEAKIRQASIHAFEKLMAGTATLEEAQEYERDWGALYALLGFAHMVNSGLSEEAANALREIEMAEASKAWIPAGNPLAQIPSAEAGAARKMHFEVAGSKLEYHSATANPRDK